MFIGHFAMGLAAKRWAPKIPLGTAFIAAQLPDVIWPFLLLAGVERVAVAPGDTVVTPLRFEYYPISHSLLMVVLWGVALGLSWRGRGHGRPGALVLASLAVSHWVLDFVSHRPDLPLAPGQATVAGLGLWNSLGATLAVEGSLFAAGIALYLTSPEARPGRGRLAFSLLAGTLAVIYLGNLFGPPPPGVTAVAVSGVVAAPALWAWGNWVDRRVTASPSAAGARPR